MKYRQVRIVNYLKTNRYTIFHGTIFCFRKTMWYFVTLKNDQMSKSMEMNIMKEKRYHQQSQLTFYHITFVGKTIENKNIASLSKKTCRLKICKFYKTFGYLWWYLAKTIFANFQHNKITSREKCNDFKQKLSFL